MDEIDLAYLRPEQIRRRIAEAPVAFIPVGPLEWHGPHCPYGTDGINAEKTAAEVCRRVGGVLWPTLFWGTERERRPEQLASLGFDRDRYVVGMDFPANSLPSCYCPEEILAILVREAIRQAGALGVRLAVVVNGHGAENQMAALRRLALEITHTTGPRVYFRMAAPKRALAGSGGHADAGETSLMVFMTDSVDLSALPALPEPLRYVDHAVVDGGGFDGKSPEHTLADEYDPRRHASADRGRQAFQAACNEIEREVGDILNEVTARSDATDGP